MQGIITKVENHGTIIIVWIENEEDSIPIYFDHRPFGHMAEAEGGDIINRQVEYDAETKAIEFLD
jgi:hypothetical protein